MGEANHATRCLGALGSTPKARARRTRSPWKGRCRVPSSGLVRAFRWVSVRVGTRRGSRVRACPGALGRRPVSGERRLPAPAAPGRRGGGRGPQGARGRRGGAVRGSGAWSGRVRLGRPGLERVHVRIGNPHRGRRAAVRRRVAEGAGRPDPAVARVRCRPAPGAADVNGMAERAGGVAPSTMSDPAPSGPAPSGPAPSGAGGFGGGALGSGSPRVAPAWPPGRPGRPDRRRRRSRGIRQVCHSDSLTSSAVVGRNAPSSSSQRVMPIDSRNGTSCEATSSAPS